MGFEVLQTQRIFKEPAAALEQLLAQHSPVLCAVGPLWINERPSEIKTKEGEKGAD